MGVLGNVGKTQETAIAILVVAFILWYFCIIIIPAIPNANCPGLTNPGASGGSSGGNCPICPACDEPPAYDPTHAPTQPYCYDGIKCPYNGYDTLFGTCRCSAGYFWDTGLQLCCPTQQIA